MQFKHIKTNVIYKQLITEPDLAKRKTMYLDSLVKPFEGVWQTFGMPNAAQPENYEATMRIASTWKLLTPETLNETALEPIRLLEGCNAWAVSVKALDKGWQQFEPFQDRIALNEVTLGIFLGEPVKDTPPDQGYSGFGGLPGYIMMWYTTPTAYNMERLSGATVHEFHHNIRFSLFPFHMNVSVAEYIVAEGLAESFATEQFGPEMAGFYVTDFNDDDLPEAKERVCAALDVRGFNAVRPYIFGDSMAEVSGYSPVGVPPFAGYALGFRAVQEYLRRTGKSVAETTFVPAEEIIEESKYFA
jgi:uncharacterized protein YjaZ